MTTQWIYGLVDMQSFYASCEVATRPEFAAVRTELNDDSDPALVVAGDPERRSGIILAATPPAKAKGVTTAMRLGEALRMVPDLIVVRPRMAFYLEVSARIQRTMQIAFPQQEQFSIDEGFFAFPYPSDWFPDPITVALEFKQRIWDQFRIRCRIGLAPNKWMAKMANTQAKKAVNGVVWWTDKHVKESLQSLPIESMWGVKKRGQVLQEEFGVRTIGDVAKISVSHLRRRFGVWGEVIHEWSLGIDSSPIHSTTFTTPHKGYSHRTTLPRDFFEREEIAVVILELLDEVCRRVRRAGQKGRRVGLALTYAGLMGGFYRARTLENHLDDPLALQVELLSILDQWWGGDGVRAVAVSLDMLQFSNSVQLTLWGDSTRRNELERTRDQICERFGETSLMRASSLTMAGQLVDRSQKIGGHYS